MKSQQVVTFPLRDLDAMRYTVQNGNGDQEGENATESEDGTGNRDGEKRTESQDGTGNREEENGSGGEARNGDEEREEESEGLSATGDSQFRTAPESDALPTVSVKVDVHEQSQSDSYSDPAREIPTLPNGDTPVISLADDLREGASMVEPSSSPEVGEEACESAGEVEEVRSKAEVTSEGEEGGEAIGTRQSKIYDLFAITV